MTRVALAFVLSLSAVACQNGPQDGVSQPEPESATRALDTAPTDLFVQEWSRRDTSVRLWPRLIHRPALMVSAAGDGRWLAMGIDARNDVILWAYTGDSAEYGQMLDQTNRDWEQSSQDLTDFNTVIAGTGGVPNPPPCCYPGGTDPVPAKLAKEFLKGASHAMIAADHFVDKTTAPTGETEIR